MCGIFGVVTKQKNSAQLTFNGLKDIEYRGYDSWGIAYWNVDNGRWMVEKEVGFLPATLKLPSSNIAIGHTRWATHGGVTKENAHPHTDCTGKIVLVHNGIVENYLELKKNLKNHKFKSETDTEIVAHLLEDQLKKFSSLEKALEVVFKKLKGLNAIVATDGKSIAACKIGSPLVVGKNMHGFYIASDPNAILLQTKTLLFLEDNQLVSFNSELNLFDLIEERGIKPRFTKVSWEHVSSSLQNYPHFMLKEIHEQPKVLRLLSQDSKDIDKASVMIKEAKGTFLIACGTASYSCIAGVYLFSKYAKKHVNFSVGSEFNYIEDYIKKESLVIAVSQSGESIDTLEPVLAAQKRGAKILALVNVLGSSLYRSVDLPILLNSGIEKAVASTKAFIAMLSMMILLSFNLVGKKKEAQKILIASAKEVENVLRCKGEINKLSKKILNQKHVYILGRGLSYAIALEAALKIKEISYIHSEGFAGGELKHGVIALIENGTPVIVFVPDDETKDAILANAMEVKARGAYVIGVGVEENPVFDFFFKVKNVGASSIIPHTVFSQLLAYNLAVNLGRNVDKPRNLAKSVVVR